MTTFQTFSTDYSEAREKFLTAAHIAGATMAHHESGTRGPRGEALFADIAWLGPDDADRVVMTISGTHGVEGFCGSGFQIDWLRRKGAAALPRGVAALHVHAINPYGFAWLRRVTEEGSDLNRNFVDHTKPYPQNPGYEEIANAVVPSALSGPIFEAAEAKLRAYRAQVGELAFFRALTGGQYTHSEGLFYGGGGPSWSNRTTHAIIDRFLTRRTDIAILDFHTGLGPYGYGDLITHYEPDSPGSKRVHAFWGEAVTESKRGQGVSQALHGLTHFAYNEALSKARVTIATLEFGAYDRESNRRALRADHWLHTYGDPLSSEAEPIRATMRKQFYPDTDEWKEMMLFRGHQVVRQAFQGVTREP
ncbi:DUF2817 domain-containing protein [Nordella sp. HKS 07]|uniref:M14 family metallopeptidase n=1 Tax=Nordella sp. HKS 07 TaxID=2712222 RepID=UPI0013E1D31A|nr:M14 family metallopeptidase [Nordella sp. HKS 07]QIG47211.1 DUF2817 domain-containing protein [Nordella sp. HKS 07]